MRVLITGARGMLGQDITADDRARGHEVIAWDREELDITVLDNVRQSLSKVCPEVIINCAAYTNVDAAENEEDAALAVNGLGVRNLALACRELDIPLVHFSTDYVFDGYKQGKYGIFDSTNPINAYGRTKLCGEKFLSLISPKYYLIRTSWLFGHGGKNFIETMIRLAQEKSELSVVSDQRGCPTFTKDLSRAVLDLIETGAYGIYHITNSGETSWFDFAKEIIKESGQFVTVRPISTEEFSSPAARPKNSVLDPFPLRETVGYLLPDWRDALKRYLKQRN